jgi:four helix bundle protein
MKSYRDLIVWQKSVDLVTPVYQLTYKFPYEEKYGLTSQIKRSSISISSNIAEGYGRNYIKDYARFLQMARGSLFEMQTQFQIAVNLDVIQEKDLQEIKSLSLKLKKCSMF